jgi:sugar lactone lactonase YvrE
MNKIHIKCILITLLLGLSFASWAQIINTIAGNGVAAFSGDGGQATAAELNATAGLAVDGYGNIYIADVVNDRIRKVNTSGIISTVAGNGQQGFSGDSGPATAAELYHPQGVTADASGNIYIADERNHRIRKVNTSGIISTIAGNGTGSYSGDGGQATNAELYNPEGILVDASGNIYIGDVDNERVRKVNTSGIITTVAGNGVQSYFGDGGPATAAELFFPTGLAMDASGILYIADNGNYRVRTVNTSGIINTFAGNGVGSYSGDGGPATAAELFSPTGVALDVHGNVSIVDYNDNHVRIVNSSGIINTLAGNGIAGYSGDGGPATAAELNHPFGVTFDANGNTLIGDGNNNRIRIVSGFTISTATNANIKCKGESSGIASVTTNGGTPPYTYLWSPGGETSSTASGLSAGTYTVIVRDNNNFTSSATVTITQPLTAMTITHDSVPDNGTCNGVAAVTVMGGSPPYSYLWSPGSQTTDTIKQQCARTYCCTITDSIGCSMYTCVTIKSTLGIVNINNSSSINIYPEPATGSFTLTGISQGQVIELYNYTGQKVLSVISHQLSTSIDISTMPDGIYLIRILNRDGSVFAAKKIVKTE